jgi:RNA polymerase sigma factor (sigma-70 family)
VDETCWTVIRGAAEGSERDREEFARRYAPVVRAYLGNRWRGTSHLPEIDDALQEVFLECFKPEGVLDRADPSRAGGFRAFLFGVVRNVAQRVERRDARRRVRPSDSSFDPDRLPAEDGGGPATRFDRAWAAALVEQAGVRQAKRARERGERETRRVELLELRFQEGLPIREIAVRWGVEPAYLHKEYARAREDFLDALRDVVAFHHPDTPGGIDRECARLLDLLG